MLGTIGGSPLAKNGKADYTKVRDTMKEFVAKYPTSDRIYSAFAFSAQLLEKEEKFEESVKTYEEYIAAHADNPAVAKAHLAIASQYRTRAVSVLLVRNCSSSS